jgi:hypothetical protein
VGRALSFAVFARGLGLQADRPGAQDNHASAADKRDKKASGAIVRNYAEPVRNRYQPNVVFGSNREI